MNIPLLLFIAELLLNIKFLNAILSFQLADIYIPVYYNP